MVKLEYLTLDKMLLTPVQDDSVSIFDVVEEAKWFIHQSPKVQNRKVLAVFTFHDVRITVSDKSSIEGMVRDYERAEQNFIIPNIGPLPKSRLSRHDKINDQIIKTANSKLLDAPAIELVDNSNWTNHRQMWKDDPSELAGMAFAERWARLAQLELIKYSVSGEPLLVQSAIDAGLPTLNFNEGREMIEDMARLLSEEWEFGELLNNLPSDPKWLDDLVRRIQPSVPAPISCESPPPPKKK